MKALSYATALLFTLAFSNCAGMAPIPEENKTFDKVFDAQNQSKDQIYLSTKLWIAETFKSSKAVIELDSKDDGLIVGNGSISYPCSGISCMTYSGWRVPFTMKVEIKEQKFRITFSNIRITAPAQPGISPPLDTTINNQSDLDKIKPELLKLGEELSTAVNKANNKADF